METLSVEEGRKLLKKKGKRKKHNDEYLLAKEISHYIQTRYPGVLFRFDMAGYNLSMAQAGMNKAIQCCRAYPDLHILAAKGSSHGFFIELKKEGTEITNGKGKFCSTHIAEQSVMLTKLRENGYHAEFGIGFHATRKLIDNYLKQ